MFLNIKGGDSPASLNGSSIMGFLISDILLIRVGRADYPCEITLVTVPWHTSLEYIVACHLQGVQREYGGVRTCGGLMSGLRVRVTN